MEFNCKVNIVDAIMGAGKTESIINLINNSSNDERFIVITPYLDEITRYIHSCPEKKFKQPMFDNHSKLDDLKKLINKQENICSTHALFQKFDNELIDLCRSLNYTLIMDEVAEVIQEVNITTDDYKTLMSYVEIHPETKQLIWKEEFKDYTGKFDDEKRLCELGSLVCYGSSLLVWLFPIETFNSFRNIYILTYMFNIQLQCYYYDYYKLPYTYLSVTGNEYGDYHLIEYDPTISHIKYNYKDLIHIIDNEKLNMIGDQPHSLSKTWYMRNTDNASMKVLQKNLTNFFRNIRNDKANDNLWTTFKDYKHLLKGKGYTKGFLSSNVRATNEYRDRTSVAYTINKFMNPFVKNFFVTNEITIDEDGYALSEMLQFIWRSAIRDGREIWVYVPSIRMRGLLEQWVKDNTIN